jgi:hypothetical protein
MVVELWELSLATGGQSTGNAALFRAHDPGQILLEVRYGRCPCSEKEVAEFVRAEHPAQFPEGKQRNESTKYYDTAGEQVIDAYIVEGSGHIFPVQKSFGHFLNNVKTEYQQAKQQRLKNSCKDQWLGFMLLAKVRVFSYQNDFGNHESIDQRSRIVEIGDVKLVEQKHAVCRKGAKEKGQIQKVPGKLLKLVRSLLPKARSLGIFLH